MIITIESNIRAPVLLNLLNELRKSNKIGGLLAFLAFYYFFPTRLTK